MDLGLTDRVVLITGPAKGMGAAITEAFAAEGAVLALLGRDTDSIAPVAERCNVLGSNTRTFACDLLEPQAVDAAIVGALDAFGRIDIVINVAGGTGPIGKRGDETTSAEFDEIVRLNMGGPFNVIRAAAPAMRARGRGSIVNVGGTFGLRGKAGRLAYSSSKWGLRGLTKSFALELGPDGINVNCVAPGMVDGPRFRDKVVPEFMARHGMTEEDAVCAHAADYALGRISTADDVANATLFLASDRARQITGVDLPVDGGWAAL